MAYTFEKNYNMRIKKSIYLQFILSALALFFLSCSKVKETRESTRLTTDIKKAMADVGRLHNVGLSQGIKDNPGWANYLKRAPIITPISGVVSVNNVGGRKVDTYEATFESLFEITRGYFRQFTIDSLPQYDIPLTVIDTMQHSLMNFG